MLIQVPPLLGKVMLFRSSSSTLIVQSIMLSKEGRHILLYFISFTFNCVELCCHLLCYSRSWSSGYPAIKKGRMLLKIGRSRRLKDSEMSELKTLPKLRPYTGYLTATPKMSHHTILLSSRQVLHPLTTSHSFTTAAATIATTETDTQLDERLYGRPCYRDRTGRLHHYHHRSLSEA